MVVHIPDIAAIAGIDECLDVIAVLIVENEILLAVIVQVGMIDLHRINATAPWRVQGSPSIHHHNVIEPVVHFALELGIRLQGQQKKEEDTVDPEVQ